MCANLTDESFARDLTDVIERAISAGVTHMSVTGATAQESRQAIDLAQRFPAHLSATAGLHPHHAAMFDAATGAQLLELNRDPQVRMVGECGLDYFRDIARRSDQKRALTAQLDIAIELGKPVLLHVRDAHDDALAIVREVRDSLRDVLVHCFTGTADECRQWLDLDCYIGITGWICDERRGLALRDIVPLIPSNRMVIETDAPYLFPRTLRPRRRRNEPCYLREVARVVASCLPLSDRHLCVSACTNNARRLLQLPEACV